MHIQQKACKFHARNVLCKQYSFSCKLKRFGQFVQSVQEWLFSNRVKRIFFFIRNSSQMLSIISDWRPHSTLPQTFVNDMKFMYTQKLIYLQINILTYLNLIMKL